MTWLLQSLSEQYTHPDHREHHEAIQQRGGHSTKKCILHVVTRVQYSKGAFILGD